MDPMLYGQCRYFYYLTLKSDLNRREISRHIPILGGQCSLGTVVLATPEMHRMYTNVEYSEKLSRQIVLRFFPAHCRFSIRSRFQRIFTRSGQSAVYNCQEQSVRQTAVHMPPRLRHIA